MYESFAIVSIEGKVYDCWRTLGHHYWRLGSTPVPPKNKHSSRPTYTHTHTCFTWILHDVIWNQLSVTILSDVFNPVSVCIFLNTSICINIYIYIFHRHCIAQTYQWICLKVLLTFSGNNSRVSGWCPRNWLRTMSKTVKKAGIASAPMGLKITKNRNRIFRWETYKENH